MHALKRETTCFHEDEKLRTVVWDFAGEPIPDDLLGAARSLLEERPGLFAAFRPYLSSEEIAALRRRIEAVLTDPFFPYPPPYRRAYPYPLL